MGDRFYVFECLQYRMIQINHNAATGDNNHQWVKQCANECPYHVAAFCNSADGGFQCFRKHAALFAGADNFYDVNGKPLAHAFRQWLSFRNFSGKHRGNFFGDAAAGLRHHFQRAG